MNCAALLIALALFLFAELSISSATLLPILCVHGWKGYSTDFATMMTEVNTSFPGRYIASVNLFDGKLSSELPLFEQVISVHLLCVQTCPT
jgi:hypothetical protein